MIEVLGVKNADKLVPTKEDIKPADPVSENMNALVGKPMKAFIYQDHDAHIATHTAFMQDPMVAQLIGQNPQAKQIVASLQAHIAEHLGFNYRKQMEEKLGAPLPPPNEELPKEVEVNLARLVADAGRQLTQEHKQQAAQRAAQAKAQDPIVQMQQQELKLKAAELQRKTQKDAADAQIKAAELQRKTVKDQADIQMDQAELAMDAKKERAKMNAASKSERLKTGLDLLDRYGAKPKEKDK
jgi:hypothetical protein